MDSAVVKNDVKAYQTARETNQLATASLEMHERQLSAFKSDPMISEADYKKLVSDIKREFNTYLAEQKERLATLSNDMESIADDIAETQTAVNNTLHKLQHDVYKDADCKLRNKNGAVIESETEKQKVDAWEIYDWGKCGVSHYQYGVYIGTNIE